MVSHDQFFLALYSDYEGMIRLSSVVDPYVPWKTVTRFAKQTGAELTLLSRGGHLARQISCSGIRHEYRHSSSREAESANLRWLGA